MDGFTYYNLFETKGTEYLIIIAFLLLIIPFWVLINRPLRSRRILAAGGRLSADTLSIPAGILHNSNHTWSHLERSGNAKVGVDDLLLHITGRVNIKNLPDPGNRITKGEILTELEQDGKVLRIASPLTGEITAINRNLGKDPAVLHEDPYGNGWIARIRPDEWQKETSTSKLSGETSEWIRKEIDRLRDFLAHSAGRMMPGSSMVYLQDGGEITDHALTAMPKEVWDEFQEKFLS